MKFKIVTYWRVFNTNRYCKNYFLLIDKKFVEVVVTDWKWTNNTDNASVFSFKQASEIFDAIVTARSGKAWIIWLRVIDRIELEVVNINE